MSQKIFNFTLIIPTHERHQYLPRSIEYFGELKARVIYCDSSNNPYIGAFYGNMEYMHLPGYTFAEKILHVTQSIQSKVIALCADDDFIILDSLYRGYMILSESDTTNTVLGKAIGFHQTFDGSFYSGDNKSIADINISPFMNASIFFSNYQQILWGMYSKEIVNKSFEIIKHAKFSNDNFIELTLGAISCFTGGIKMIDDIWSVRELAGDIHWGDRHKNITYSFKTRTNTNDFKKYISIIDFYTCKGYAKNILRKYMKLTAVGYYYEILKGNIKRVSFYNMISKVAKKSYAEPSDSFVKYSTLTKITFNSNSSLLNIYKLLSRQ